MASSLTQKNVSPIVVVGEMVVPNVCSSFTHASSGCPLVCWTLVGASCELVLLRTLIASCDMDNFLTAHTQSDKKGQHLALKSGTGIHVAIFVDVLSNKDVSSICAYHLRHTRGDSAVCVPLQEDAAHGVLPGTPCCSLLTFQPQVGSSITSAAIFSYVETRVNGKSATNMLGCTTAMVVGEYMPFQNAGEGKRIWIGRYGTEVLVPTTAITFVEVQFGPNTRWLVESGTWNAFVDSSQNITTCPALHAKAYPLVHTTSACDSMKTKPCLFRGADMVLNNMMGHVTNQFLDGDSLQDKADARQHPVYGFFGATAGKCNKQLVGMKMTSNCPYFYAFRYAPALKRRGNVPRKCLVALCVSTPFT